MTAAMASAPSSPSAFSAATRAAQRGLRATARPLQPRQRQQRLRQQPWRRWPRDGRRRAPGVFDNNGGGAAAPIEEHWDSAGLNNHELRSFGVDIDRASDTNGQDNGHRNISSKMIAPSPAPPSLYPCKGGSADLVDDGT
eukprot:scaffold3328_cov247-Prasinococcus_capsulatus_cf.AAC.3